MDHDGKILYARDQSGDRRDPGLGDVDVYPAAIYERSDALAEILIDGRGYITRGGEIRFAQHQRDGRQMSQIERGVAFYSRAGGGSADGDVIHGFGIATAADCVTPEGKRALRFGVDVAIGGVHGR